jgi:cytochrome c oxidase assembly factor CtaG
MAHTPLSCFVVQLLGAIRGVSEDIRAQEQGLHIYTGGVIFQAAFILAFCGLSYLFYNKTVRNRKDPETALIRKLVFTLQVVLALIMVSLSPFRNSTPSPKTFLFI